MERVFIFYENGWNVGLLSLMKIKKICREQNSLIPQTHSKVIDHFPSYHFLLF